MGPSVFKGLRDRIVRTSRTGVVIHQRQLPNCGVIHRQAGIPAGGIINKLFGLIAVSQQRLRQDIHTSICRFRVNAIFTSGAGGY